MDTCLPAGREWRFIRNYIMAYVVYAIKSSFDNRIYVGFTVNLEKRIKEHNQGKTKSTKGSRPWVLLYNEIVENRIEARKREKFLKSGCGKEFLKNKYWPQSSMDRMEVS
jgi:putative endonuclease